jgi:cytochrome b subunit of formate dehydrogenase
VAAAAGAALPTRQECLACHGERAIAEAVPGPSGERLFVSDSTLVHSAHRGLECSSCHRDASSIPHPERLADVTCASCHADAARSVAQSAHRAAKAAACEGCHGGGHAVRAAASAGEASCRSCHAQVVDEYAASAHGVARSRGEADAATCRSCHGAAHDVRAQVDPRAGTSRVNIAMTCATCHADRALVVRRKIAIPEAVALYRNSVHGRSQDPAAATCSDCHEPHAIRPANDPAASIAPGNTAKTCGRCHGAEARAYAVSVHATALARDVRKAPTCTDCHGEHLIRGPRDADSPVSEAGVSTTCSSCHEAQGIRETYGLPAGRLSTYEDSFHGLAARWGQPAVANCASCHGFHDVLPSSDSRSWVSPERLPETCGQCHPGAGARFAMGPVHVAMATPSQPALYWVRWIYLVLIAATVGGMVLHNGLDFFSKLRRSLLAHLGKAVHLAGEAGRQYVRMTRGARWQHGLLAASFFALVYSGFALKFPEAWPFAWLARLEVGYEWRRWLHRGAALVMVGVSLFHLGFLVTPAGRRMLRDMRPSGLDLRQVGENLLYMVGRRPDPPAFERFGYVEKAEYWALLWGTAVMSATGFALWFADQSLRVMPKWMLDLATLVHYYEAWLAFLAILVWHLYQVIANPDVDPMNWTWLTGRISEERLRHEHRAEWEALRAEEEAPPGRGAPAD